MEEKEITEDKKGGKCSEINTFWEVRCCLGLARWDAIGDYLYS